MTRLLMSAAILACVTVVLVYLGSEIRSTTAYIVLALVGVVVLFDQLTILIMDSHIEMLKKR